MRRRSSDAGRVGVLFQRGDPAAAEEVRGRVSKIVAFRGYRIPAEDQRDLVQAAMIQIWQAAARPEFDPRAGFWGFVEVVASRRCIDWLRRQREEVPLEESLAGPDRGDDPHDRTLLHERRELALAAVARLPARCRELLRLHLEAGKSYAEAAAILGTSEGALRVRMHRCIRRAQRILRDLEGR